jgi:DNA-binding Lrp family transcriptional regulator
MLPLKPQDIAVALQLALTPGLTYAALATATGISQGEVHNAVRRLRGARLVLAEATQVHRPALLEFLGSGVPYAFPAEAGAESRGVPTAHAAGVLGEGFSTTEFLVWPSVEGRARGASVVPLYDGAASTAARNPALYELLALVDAVRLGRARERIRAKQLLRERLAVATVPSGTPE